MIAAMRAFALLLAIAFVAGCETQASLPPAPQPVATAPDDWIAVAADGGDLQLTLPPWLGVFEKSGGIFANEAPPAPGAEIPVQLYAQGPDASAQTEFGGDLRRWIELRVSGPAQGAPNPGEGLPTVTRVQLPAGPAMRYQRIDRAGTGLEWRFLVFAIETRTGLAYLQIDGTPGGWAAHAGEFDRIAALLRTR